VDSGRAKIIVEETHELMCARCPFNILEVNEEADSVSLRCNVPLGTCAYRPINGLTGHYVGDLLEQAGLIDSGWDKDVCSSQIPAGLEVDIMKGILEKDR
jgi:hypothetical protein